MHEPPIGPDVAEARRWLGDLYDRHAAGVYGYALRLTGRNDLAEDVVAETFLRAWRGRAGFRGDAQPLTWLIRIASRAALDALGRMRVPTVAPAADTTDPPAGPLESAERERVLAAALARLPHAQREVVVLKQFVGLRFTQIADALDCPLGTVLGRMHRALRRLADDPDLREWMGP
jgi:RNA polymerase sigma-70 factor (ECF subfamily)